jgi:hypothetical protein
LEEIDDVMDNGISVKDFIKSYFGYKDSFLPVVAVVVLGYTILFASAFAFFIKTLNFQKEMRFCALFCFCNRSTFSQTFIDM